MVLVREGYSLVNLEAAMEIRLVLVEEQMTS